MNEHDMRAKIATVINMLKADNTPRSPKEQQLAEAVIIGAELLGELLIDIKRASNALDKRIE